MRRSDDETRQADRERKRRRYAEDPVYRQKIIDANMRHYYRRGEDPAYHAHRAELARASYHRQMANNPDAIKNRRLRDWDRRQVGWTPERYEEMLDAQEGQCASCGDTFTTSPHCDHDHATNQPRGLLCASCNRGIGMFKDDPDRLEAAANYLRTWTNWQKGESVA